MKYIVIRIELDHDCISGVECVASFETEQAANDFVVDEEEKRLDSIRKLFQYIDGFVEALDLSANPREIYKQFGVRFPSFSNDLKQNLKCVLQASGANQYPGYSPPEIYSCGDLHVVAVGSRRTIH